VALNSLRGKQPDRVWACIDVACAGAGQFAPRQSDQAVNVDTHVLVPELIVFINDVRTPPTRRGRRTRGRAGRSDRKHASRGRKAPSRTILTDRAIGSNRLGIDTDDAERSNVIRLTGLARAVMNNRGAGTN
jgi:hypothetical protein